MFDLKDFLLLFSNFPRQGDFLIEDEGSDGTSFDEDVSVDSLIEDRDFEVSIKCYMKIYPLTHNFFLRVYICRLTVTGPALEQRRIYWPAKGSFRLLSRIS